MSYKCCGTVEEQVYVQFCLHTHENKAAFEQKQKDADNLNNQQSVIHLCDPPVHEVDSWELPASIIQFFGSVDHSFLRYRPIIVNGDVINDGLYVSKESNH